MQNGGCLPDGDGQNNQNSCPDAKHPFTGAKFQYLSANVTSRTRSRRCSPPYTIKKVDDGRRSAFIGMTLEDTPNIVTKSGVEGLTFTDEVETANALVPILSEGREVDRRAAARGRRPGRPDGVQRLPGITGRCVDIAAGLDPAIDVIITGHTHQAYNCTLLDSAKQPRLVTSASSFGRLVTDVALQIDTATGDVDPGQPLAEQPDRHPGRACRTARRTALIDQVQDAGRADRQQGDRPHHQRDVRSVADARRLRGESPLGNLIADAQLADQRS